MSHTVTAELTPIQPLKAPDRRRGNRQPLGASGLLTAVGDAVDKQLQVFVLNVSLHGVGFRAPVYFRPGAMYQMRIGSGPLHLTSRLKIVSSREREDGTWDVGAKFV
jgi:hypothetical protein